MLLIGDILQIYTDNQVKRKWLKNICHINNKQIRHSGNTDIRLARF